MDRYRFRVANKHSFKFTGGVSKKLDGIADYCMDDFIVVYTTAAPAIPLFAIFDDFELQIFKNNIKEGLPHTFTYRTELSDGHSYSFLVAETEFKEADYTLHVNIDGEVTGSSGCEFSLDLREGLKSWIPTPEYYKFTATIEGYSMYISRIDHLPSLLNTGVNSIHVYNPSYNSDGYVCTLFNKEQINLFMTKVSGDGYCYLGLDIRGNRLQPYDMKDDIRSFIIPSKVLVLNNKFVAKQELFDSYYAFVSWRYMYERCGWKDTKYEFRVYRIGRETPVAAYRSLDDFSVSMADFIIEVCSASDGAIICKLMSKQDVEIAKKSIVRGSKRDYWFMHYEQVTGIPLSLSEFKSPTHIIGVDENGNSAGEGCFSRLDQLTTKLASLELISKQDVIHPSRYSYVVIDRDTRAIISVSESIDLKEVDYCKYEVAIYPKGSNGALIRVCNEYVRTLAEQYIDETMDKNIWFYYKGFLADLYHRSVDGCVSVSVERDGSVTYHGTVHTIPEQSANKVAWDPHKEQRELTESNRQHNNGARYIYFVQAPNEVAGLLGHTITYEELDDFVFSSNYVLVTPRHDTKTAVYMLNCSVDVEIFKRHINGIIGTHYWVKCKGRGRYLSISEVNEKTFEAPARLLGVSEAGNLVEDTVFTDYATLIAYPDTPPSQHTPVSPKHYKNFFKDFEWLEVMSEVPTMKEHFEVALELQVRKYLDRRGQKDESVQELKKGLVYFLCMIQLIEHGKFDLEKVHDIVRQV
jgi:hypothetical protein